MSRETLDFLEGTGNPKQIMEVDCDGYFLRLRLSLYIVGRRIC